MPGLATTDESVLLLCSAGTDVIDRIVARARENNLSLEPFSFPKNDENCTPTHPNNELDDTCVYDLSEPWVKDYIEKNCN